MKITIRKSAIPNPGKYDIIDNVKRQTINFIKEKTTGAYSGLIPIEYWDDFKVYLRETRMPCCTVRTCRDGITIRFSDALDKSDVYEYLSFFFDTILEVHVE